MHKTGRAFMDYEDDTYVASPYFAMGFMSLVIDASGDRRIFPDTFSRL